MQVYTLTDLIILLGIPFAIWYWGQIRWIGRLAIFIAIGFRLVPGILTGTMVDIGVVIIEIVVSIFALASIGRIKINLKPKLLFLAFIFIVVFLVLAIQILLSRADALGWQPWMGGQLNYYNPDNSLSYVLGPKLAFGIYSLSSYVTQGYEGLGQCLRLGFVWTYGIGHSRALMEYAAQYLGWDWIWNRHYLWRNYLVTGRNPLTYWSTALPWIASDVSFWGVPIVIFLIGKYFGRVWRNLVENGDPITLAIFIRLIVLILFLPANFQIFQGRVMWWGTMGLLVLWFIKKIRGLQNKQKIMVQFNEA